MTYNLSHQLLGSVHVAEHPTSRRITARWKNGRVKLTVPVYASLADVKRALDTMAPDLLKNKPAPGEMGDITFADWHITVSRQNLDPDRITVNYTLPEVKLMIGSGIDTGSEQWHVFYNKVLHAVGKKVAPTLLLPRARTLAQSLGCTPTGWKISHGNQVLGHCNAGGNISLSYVNVFLPPHLRDYIICHELAHLTHMNHSQQFHALCDWYLGGRERQLINELKHYRWPLRRK